jgi:hypothetical protein
MLWVIAGSMSAASWRKIDRQAVRVDFKNSKSDFFGVAIDTMSFLPADSN